MMPRSFLAGRVALYPGDCRETVAALAGNSVDAVVTDPPYALDSIRKRFGKDGSAPAKPGTDGAFARASAGFMGQKWDTGETAFDPAFWAEVWRVLKPGGHVAAFGGTRTYHRLAVAIEDAGFEIRDQLAWAYGSGFPKSHDVSKAIGKAMGRSGDKIATGAAVKRMIPGADQHRNGWEKDNGREYQPGDYVPATDDAAAWQGWGTALKPAWEPIVLARKPLIGTVAANVLEHGTGAINIDGCRVGWESDSDAAAAAARAVGFAKSRAAGKIIQSQSIGKESRGGENTYHPDRISGRWPANIVHDGSDEVLAGFIEAGNDSGSAARFFYTAKADADDRLGSGHPTVKPVGLMQWLCRLVTPPGGVVLDPFAGTGTTGEAAFREGFCAILCEREAAYQADIARRMDLALAGPATRRAERARAKAARRPATAQTDIFGMPPPSLKAAGFTENLPTRAGAEGVNVNRMGGV